ncbi:MAG: hypothetical protein AABX89_02515 [Candidatus Thermoplasmatota archaeon]
MSRPIRSRWGLRPVQSSLEAAPGTRIRFLVEATNWGPGPGAVHLRASSEWPVTVQPESARLDAGHIHLAAVRVEVPAEAMLGERMAIHVVLHGAARPVECDLEVVVAGDRAVVVPTLARSLRGGASKGGR